MIHSIFWARFIGLYAVILAAWCFYDANQLYPLLTELSKDPLMIMNYGIFTILIGLAILVSHFVWQGWPILVTVMGGLVTLKGIALLFFPQFLSKLVPLYHDKNILFAPLPSLVLGLVLLYFGFIHHRSH